MTQKETIVGALKEYGPLTSHEVDAVVGFGVAICSAQLSSLVDDGIVRRETRFTRYPRYDGFAGRYCNRWHLSSATHP